MDSPESAGLGELREGTSPQVSVDFDGRFLVVQSSAAAPSVHDFSEDEFIPDDWAEQHPDWLADHAVGIAEQWFEEVWG